MARAQASIGVPMPGRRSPLGEGEECDVARTRHLQHHEGYRITPHPHHARLYRIVLNLERLRSFFAAIETVKVQNLEHVPYMRYVIAQALAERIGGSFKETIRAIVRDRNSGAFTLGVEGAATHPDDFVKFGTAIGHLIGPANFDAMSGAYYARFASKHAVDGDSYLVEAYRKLTLHTDGAFVSEATDWLLMMKLKECSAIGGESRVIHLDDWEDLEAFANHPLASHPFTFKAPSSKNVSNPVQHPTFFEMDGRPCISVAERFVYPETIEQATYLSKMFDSLEASAATVCIPLPVGDLIVLNNRFWMHGRAAFKEHPDLYRELMRQRGVFSKD